MRTLKDILVESILEDHITEEDLLNIKNAVLMASTVKRGHNDYSHYIDYIDINTLNSIPIELYKQFDKGSIEPIDIIPLFKKYKIRTGEKVVHFLYNLSRVTDISKWNEKDIMGFWAVDNNIVKLLFNIIASKTFGVPLHFVHLKNVKQISSFLYKHLPSVMSKMTSKFKKIYNWGQNTLKNKYPNKKEIGLSRGTTKKVKERNTLASWTTNIKKAEVFARNAPGKEGYIMKEKIPMSKIFFPMIPDTVKKISMAPSRYKREGEYIVVR